MRKGTTPTHEFVLPFSADMIGAVEITYAQSGAVILTKKTEECALNDNIISVTLSQEDTFLFNSNIIVDCQIRVLTTGGDVLSSDVCPVACERCLSNEVLA